LNSLNEKELNGELPGGGKELLRSKNRVFCNTFFWLGVVWKFAGPLKKRTGGEKKNGNNNNNKGEWKCQCLTPVKVFLSLDKISKDTSAQNRHTHNGQQQKFWGHGWPNKK
jgi:hypothetical protein